MSREQEDTLLVLQKNDLPPQSIVMSGMISRIADRLLDISEAAAELFDRTAKELLPRFALKMIDDDNTRIKFLISFIEEEKPESGQLAWCIRRLQKIGIRITKRQSVNLRSYFILGCSIVLVHHFCYLTSYTHTIEEGAKDLAKRYLLITTITNLSVQQKGYGPSHRKLMKCLEDIVGQKAGTLEDITSCIPGPSRSPLLSSPPPPRIKERKNPFPLYQGPFSGVQTLENLKETVGQDIGRELILKLEDGEFKGEIVRVSRWNGSCTAMEVLNTGQKLSVKNKKRLVSVYSAPEEVLDVLSSLSLRGEPAPLSTSPLETSPPQKDDVKEDVPASEETAEDVNDARIVPRAHSNSKRSISFPDSSSATSSSNSVGMPYYPAPEFYPAMWGIPPGIPPPMPVLHPYYGAPPMYPVSYRGATYYSGPPFYPDGSSK